jgi:hypothetical protein
MRPYLSFVIAARNDNYGGDFVGRLQLFVNALLAMWEKHGLDTELVIVEWNPPPGKPRLKDAMLWPNSAMLDRVTIVEVPHDVHRRFANSDRMPIFEYIAKNAGIRRAQGTFVLSTNPDLLFSDGLIKFFASRKLKPDCYYRVNRYDVAESIPTSISVDGQLRFCSRHAFRFHRAKRTLALNGPRRLFHYISQTAPWFRPVRTAFSFFSRRQVTIPRKPASTHSWSRRVHTNASGDFMLMSAESWEALRGYPELTTHSHIDSYLVYVAVTAGLKQVVRPDPIYHLEHDRSEQSTRPLTVLDKIPAFREMIEKHRPHIANSENWGLADVDLPSSCPGRDNGTFEAMSGHSVPADKPQRIARG